MSAITRTRFVTVFTALLVLLSAPALGYERKGAYVGGGLGFGKANVSDQGLTFTDNPDDDALLVEGHGGYRFNPYFALEGQILGAANDSNNNNDNYDSSIGDISFGGIAGRALGMFPVSEMFDLYAAIGFYTGSSEVGYSDTEDESGVVYGAGAQMNFGGRGQFGVRAEYVYYEGDELLDDVDGVTLSFQYNFFR